MKRLLLVCIALATLYSVGSAHYRHGSGGVSFGIFYSSLEPHGEWILVDRGVYAWRPFDTFVGWRPYTVGRWAWTRYGWYWVSNEPWGWATYHYGRWYFDDFYGWLWIPGYEWAPAWVEWRYGGPYVGWAPLGPYALFSIHVGIHYRYRWVTPVHYWTFVDCRYISSPTIHRHVYRSDDNRRYIGRTRNIGSVRSEQGRIVSSGPDREYVERQGRIRISPAEVVDIDDRQERISRSGDRDRIEVYRPRITDTGRDEADVRPSRVRETDRKIGIDFERTDVRKPERDRGVERGARVEENSRPPRDRSREQEQVRPRETDRRSPQQDVQRKPREERSVDTPPQQGERQSSGGRESIERPNTERRTQPQPRTEPQRERQREEVKQPDRKKEETRAAPPERSVRRNEARPQEKGQEQKRGDRPR